MEIAGKILERIAFNTRSRIEEHMLIDMKKPTHEEHLSQPVQTNNKQFKIAVTFPTGYNGIFSVTNSNNKFFFTKSISDADDFVQGTLKSVAYEFESLSKEIKRIFIDQGLYSENEYPFTKKPKFSSLCSIIERSPQ